ncbi:coronatine-insensitive protein 1 isoform X2 [Impatiens glandulifera]|nr:coronatine-insensitive protein 1 isoform X2 [Impatiens glandulifera]
MEDGRKFSRANGVEMPETVLQCVISNYIHDPRDRDALSLVCRRWYEIDSTTRKHVTIALCYSSTPNQLLRRFPNLNSITLKGKPRAAMFNLIPENWGGYATPWVEEFARSFNSLTTIHFRRMIVKDSDLELLARSRAKVLIAVKLDKCSGFSTDGILCIARHCKNLRTLFLEESNIKEKDGEWLHELALNNTVLETLNFYMTDLNLIKSGDLEHIARNCPSLVSVKINECELLELCGFFQAAVGLQEFAGGSFGEQPEKYSALSFPQRLCGLGFTYMGRKEMFIIFPVRLQLRRLDLLYAFLDTEDHCLLIQQCPNLEVLETRNVIGDQGLEALAQYCKKLKRLRIERGADERGIEDEGGLVSQRGLTALAHGCVELEYIAVYVTDITNACFECIGSKLKNLRDFRFVLLDREERITDLPLDNGVRALLQGCQKLKRFALYVRPGGLTDVGMGYIGRYSQNVRWMLLGYVGESDAGLIQFSAGCPSLQKLEMRGCCFSEGALALATLRLTSLKYFWIQGYRSTNARDLLIMTRPFWNIEVIPATRIVADVEEDQGAEMPVIIEHPAHILAYFSLAGQRTDFPEEGVMPLEAA